MVIKFILEMNEFVFLWLRFKIVSSIRCGSYL